VISGDGGGTVSLTMPLRMVRCNSEALAQLAAELDATAWDDLSPLDVTIEHLPVRSRHERHLSRCGPRQPSVDTTHEESEDALRSSPDW
jgi:hypothetical protein